MCLATMAYVSTSCAVHVTIFSTGSKFQILWSYTLLPKPPVVMRSCNKSTLVLLCGHRLVTGVAGVVRQPHCHR